LCIYEQQAQQRKKDKCVIPEEKPTNHLVTFKLKSVTPSAKTSFSLVNNYWGDKRSFDVTE